MCRLVGDIIVYVFDASLCTQVEHACSLIDQILSSPQDREKILFGTLNVQTAASERNQAVLSNCSVDTHTSAFELADQFQRVVQLTDASVADLQPDASSMSWQDKCRSAVRQIIESAVLLEADVDNARNTFVGSWHEESEVSTLKQDSPCASPLTVDTSMPFSLAMLEDLMICPITQVRFVDPVVAADGITYENEAIAAWISLCPTDKDVYSPYTREKLMHRLLVPNQIARQILAKM